MRSRASARSSWMSSGGAGGSRRHALSGPIRCAAGITPDLAVVIAGVDTAGGHFTGQILDDALELDVKTARTEHVTAAARMIEEHPQIGAFVLECTNMPPYAADIADATGRPVYDLTTMVIWAATASRRRRFEGYL